MSEIFDKVASYIRICGGFRYVVRRFFLDKLGRGDTSDISRTSI